ncbi:MAG: CPBP family intramembrane metalloprotease [Phycisphaerae bacterium]|nr:CPBP family intramembrane metalloprotease [Phycisphaerae bacterium]
MTASLAGFLAAGAACALCVHAGSPLLVATDAIDQASVASSPRSGPSVAIIVPAIYAALTIVLIAVARRRHWFRIDPGVIPPEKNAGIYGFGFFALLLAQAFGAYVAARLLGLSGGPSDRREKALLMLGGYAIQLPLALALGLTFGILRKNRSTLALAGLATLALAWPVIQTAYVVAASTQKALTQGAPPSVGHETLAEIATGSSDPWAAVIVVCVVVCAPLIEEIGYRGALQGCLRALRLKAWPAILVTSSVFVVMHLPALSMDGLAGSLAQLFVLSVALGLIRERTQSLLPCVVAHAAFNALNIVLAKFLATLAAP